MKGIIYTDGACKGNPGPSSIGIVLKDEYGNTVGTHSEHIGHGTSKNAEYAALKKGLSLAKERGFTDLTCYSDSEILVHHVNGKKYVAQPNLVNHMLEIRNHLDDFDKVNVVHVRRHFNTEADAQANIVFRRNKVQEHIMDSL